MVALVVFADHRERVQDVLHLVAGQAVDVEHRRVQFRLQERAAVGVPGERRAVVAEVARIRRRLVRGVGQFGHPRGDVLREGDLRLPRRRPVEGTRVRHGDLVEDAVGEVGTADLLAHDIVAGEGRPDGLEERSEAPVREIDDGEDVPDCRPRQGAGHERPGVTRTGDVTPAKKPLSVPAIPDSALDVLFRHPVPCERLLVRVAVVDVVQSRKRLHPELGLGGVLVGRVTVVKVAEQFGLVQGEPPLVTNLPRPAVEGGSECGEVVGGAEEAGVIGHIEHAQERKPPRISVRGFVPNQDGMATVNFEGHLSVLPSSEERERPGIRVEEKDF